ncbi:MAG TPA: HAD-IIA family hydrolase [Kineosporiaceae bacterium]|nr:HAD-IIA family hydrolase [Kineosporiaceae bacterium]
MTDTVHVEQPALLGTDVPLTQVYDLALLDLDGVVYISQDAVPGAAEALDRVRAAGVPVRFVTNNASRPPEVVADHLTRLGVPATVDEVVTSAQVASALLARRLSPGAGVLVVGAEGLRQALTENGLVPMDSVDEGPVAVVQGFGPDVGWRLLAEATRAVRSGLYWMATNLDLTVPTAHGPAPGNGSLVQLVATVAGRGPDEVAGKPRPGAFLEAARQAGCHRPLVVGDRLDTDLEGARAAGMHGLLVLTGVTGATELLAAPADLRPHYVGRDLDAMMVPHPAARLTGTTRAGCRDSVAEVVRDGDTASVRVLRPGSDPVCLLRAAAVAAWADQDGGDRPAPDLTGLLSALRGMDSTAGWAR